MWPTDPLGFRFFRVDHSIPGSGAFAIRAGAEAIITFNLYDFPPAQLGPHNVEAKHPDDFVLESLDLAPAAVVQLLVEQAAALTNPPVTVGQILDRLRELDLVQSVARFRELFGSRLT